MAQHRGDPESRDHLVDILEELRAADRNRDGYVSMREIVDTFGGRVFGPVLFILGLLQVLPTGAIPLITGVVGILALLLSGQMLIKPGRPWLPARLLDVKVPQPRLERAIDRARPWVEKVDRWLWPRLTLLVTGPALIVLALAGAATGVLIFLLGFVPGAAAVPALALVCFGVGLTTRDGVAILAGYVIIVGSALLGLYLTGWL